MPHTQHLLKVFNDAKWIMRSKTLNAVASVFFSSSFHLVILCLFGCKLQNIAKKHIYLTYTHISFLHGFDFNEQPENRSW